MKRQEINKNDRIRGSLIAGAIGDALGYPIEFEKNIVEKQVTKYVNGKGLISDDTQMTLFTANALLFRATRMLNKGIALPNSNAIYLAYLDWLETQTGRKNEKSISWIKNISELNEKRAPGNTCLNALLSGKMGTMENIINNSKGCGTVMRIAPVGLYVPKPLEAAQLAAEASAITHGHELGMIPSYFEAILINILLNKDLSFEQSLNETIQLYQKNKDLFSKENNDYFLNLVNKAINLSKENISDIEAIKQLGEGWVAEEAFAIALYSCLKHQNSIEDALISAVNHDGDSDSTGAIAGNIIGTYLGYSSIDKYYIDNLELKDLILEIADDLSIPVPTPYIKQDNTSWDNKYIYRDINQNGHIDKRKNKGISKLFYLFKKYLIK